MQRLSPGDIVRHFKRETIATPGDDYLYRIITFAIHSETRERFVVYQALYGDRQTFIRPFDMFMSEVDKKKYPSIKQHWRFEKL